MEQKIAVVTGANSGMGLATTLALAQEGNFVVMLCRSRERGASALAHVHAQTGTRNAALMVCDLGDMASIRAFCADFVQNYPRLDILINNAGILSFKCRETKDGLEAHFGICHIGHFLLTNLLLGHMSPHARVVMVGSSAHRAGKVHFDDLGLERGYSIAKAYSRAKLCNLLFTKELARRLKGTGVSVNCVHPGAVITNIGARHRHENVGVGLFRRVAGVLVRPFVKTPEEGAATAVYVATSKACAGISGGYFASCRQVRPSAAAQDRLLAQKLWAVSEEITGLSVPV